MVAIWAVIVSIGSLSPVNLAREQGHTLGTYTRDPDGLINSVICFHGLQFPQINNLTVCSFPTVVDQVTRPLATD